MPVMPERYHLGRVAALFQHPVKSMAATARDTVALDWHGVVGDRRLAFRRIGVRTNFPWLSASHMADLLRYRPISVDGAGTGDEPTHVMTPSGECLELWSDALRIELSERFGAPLELLHLRAGTFDEAGISVISKATIEAIERETGRALDIRRFRPNVVIEPVVDVAFGEDDWVGRSIEFGAEGPSVSVTMRDVRCSMLGLDPDSSEADPSIFKAVVRMNDATAGIYGTVTRIGSIAIGDDVFVVGG